MKKRQIINIDENKCDGCGNCVTGCQEGALEIIDGKAKLVNEVFCDGFGDCIGECPTGALTIEERKAKEFDLNATKEHVRKKRGDEAVQDMLVAQEAHAQDHDHEASPPKGCPGTKMKTMKKNKENNTNNKNNTNIESQLQNWPVQIHLLPPEASYFENADLLVAADCVPVAYPNYHQDILKEKVVALGCPKLDKADAYVEKFADIIANNDLNSITIARMEVPCCGGLIHIIKEAIEQANSDLEIEIITVGVEGELK